MIIELNFADLQLLAVNSEVVKNGITIKVNRPILPSLNTLLSSKNEYVVFTLDGGDPLSEQWAFKPNKSQQ